MIRPPRHLTHADFVAVSTDLLRSGYGIRFQARGWSMYPTIREGDVITAQPTDPTQVRPGDILLCTSAGRLVVHRAISVQVAETGEVLFLLRGDGSTQADGYVPAGDILGKVVGIERNGRNIRLTGRLSKVQQATGVAIARLGRRIRKQIRRVTGHLANPKTGGFL
ncbi:MAG: hypothetical protein N3D11_15095 [Candidatus Sumerlaeia bacterium]|nr:hypothetical protein [Candidatus Sumerlaeia bacterium]